MNTRYAAWCFGLLVSIYASLVAAHDFWLQPSQYWVDADALTPLTLQVGHGPFRQRSPVPERRITRFQALAPTGAVLLLRDRLSPGQPTQDGDFRLTNLGTYVLILQTDAAAQTHLPAIRFNDYLRAEGLTPALEQRARLHLTESDGSERYSRCAKSLVQVGAPDSRRSNQVIRPVGLPLEIVPEVNPYDTSRPESLPVSVMYEGMPLPGALVKLTNLDNDASPFEVHLTDRDGRASFTMPASGSWLLNVIWTRALPRTEETDFETIFSSLSFGFPSSNR